MGIVFEHPNNMRDLLYRKFPGCVSTDSEELPGSFTLRPAVKINLEVKLQAHPPRRGSLLNYSLGLRVQRRTRSSKSSDASFTRRRLCCIQSKVCKHHPFSAWREPQTLVYLNPPRLAVEVLKNRYSQITYFFAPSRHGGKKGRFFAYSLSWPLISLVRLIN